MADDPCATAAGRGQHQPPKPGVIKMGTMTTGPLLIEVWRDDVGGVTASNVAAEQAFSADLLMAADGKYLSYDGQTITLDVDNGRWVWQVTGRNEDGSVVYGRWPD